MRDRLDDMLESAPDIATRDARDLRRGDFAVLRDIPTRWADVDFYGHVNNVVHYSLFDTAVNGWLIEASGVDIRRLDAIGLVVETSCRSTSPASLSHCRQRAFSTCSRAKLK